MSPRNKKNRGQRQNASSTTRKLSSVIPSTIRDMFGTHINIFYLLDFLHHYVPSLSLPAALEGTLHNERLRQTVVCTSKSLQPVASIRNAEFRESLPSIVDDVIWSLVQRRDRMRRKQTRDYQQYYHQGKNVLSQGYVLASEHLQQNCSIRPCPNMRPGVLCTDINSNVSFCKTSALCKSIHRLVGDEVLRILLLHTTILLPIPTEKDSQSCRGNYLHLCGPPLQFIRGKTIASPSISLGYINTRNDIGASSSGANLTTEEHMKMKRKKRRRKRKRSDNETPTSSKKTAAYCWEPNASIPRYSLFYSNSYVPKVGLPSSHILNLPESNETLLNSMFHLYVNGKKRRKRWNRLKETGISMCTAVFKMHSKCDYARLLERYCPIPTLCDDHPGAKKSKAILKSTKQGKKGENSALADLAASHTPSDHVVSFLGAILRKVFPPEFWGSEHNFQLVMISVTSFVKLRRREELPNKAIMHGIRTTDVAWLFAKGDPKVNTSREKTSRTNHEATTTLVQHMMRWIFCQFLIPLLRSTFYVTESEFSAKRVLFYRKPVWSRFRSLSIKSLLTQQYTEIDSKEATRRLKDQKMGLSLLRLLPKTTGVRPLAILSKRELVKTERGNALDRHVGDANGSLSKRRRINSGNEASQQLRADARFRSTNRILKCTFDVLRYEVSRKPHIFGSGLFGLNEVYPLYQQFLQQIKGPSQSASLDSSLGLYFASVDIRRCYDNINQTHLFNIAESLLSEEDYLIQNCAVIHPCDSMGRVLKKTVKQVGPPESFNQFHNIAEGLSHRFNRSIFVDGVSCEVAKKEDLLVLLQEHLCSHIVVAKGRYGDRFLVQSKKGIPQGSVLSSLLCNAYYGHEEMNLLNGVFLSTTNETCDSECVDSKIPNHEHLLVRIVDDFLLITTDRDTSVRFLGKMNIGNPQLGIQINRAKTLANYSVQLENPDGKLEDVAIAQSNGNFFPWCGMLFNTHSGEVRVDYARFAGTQAVDAITVDRTGSEGFQLRLRMKTFVRPRCQPILFDSQINSKETVVLNFVQILLLCAVKTAKYITGMEGESRKNVSFILICIDDTIQYSHTLTMKNLAMNRKGTRKDFLCCISRSDALWLGRDAFQSVFRQLGGEAKEVADQLQEKCGYKAAAFHRWGQTSRLALKEFDIRRFIVK